MVDGIVRGAVLLHKGREIEIPLKLLCTLEIKNAEAGERVRGVSALGENRQGL